MHTRPRSMLICASRIIPTIPSSSPSSHGGQPTPLQQAELHVSHIVITSIERDYPVTILYK